MGARAVLERAVELGKANLSEDDPDVLRTAYQLGTVLQKADDPAGARRVLEEAYAAGLWRLGDSDPLMLEISHDIGVVAEELGNRHEARKAFTRVAELGPATLGAGHWAVARARAYLGQDQNPDVRTETPAPPSTPWQPRFGSPGSEHTPGPATAQPGVPATAPPFDPGPGIPPARTRPAADAGPAIPPARTGPAVDPGLGVPPARTGPAADAGPAIPPARTRPDAGRDPGYPDTDPRLAAGGQGVSGPPAPIHPGIDPRQASADHAGSGTFRYDTDPGLASETSGPAHPDFDPSRAPHTQGTSGPPHTGVDPQAAQGLAGPPYASVGPRQVPPVRGVSGPPYAGVDPRQGEVGFEAGDQTVTFPAVNVPEQRPGEQGGDFRLAGFESQAGRDGTDGPGAGVWVPQPPVPYRPAQIEQGGGWGQTATPYIVEPVGGAPAEAKRGLGIFAAIAAVLAAVIAVAALVFVLVNPSRDPGGENDVPTLGGSPPTGVQLKDQGARITVRWTDPTDGTVSFLVAMGHPGEQLKPVTTLGPGQTSYEISGLNATLNYCFAVVAVYRNNKFATSAQACTNRPS